VKKTSEISVEIQTTLSDGQNGKKILLKKHFSGHKMQYISYLVSRKDFQGPIYASIDAVQVSFFRFFEIA
jgi:hypothetical protein